MEKKLQEAVRTKPCDAQKDLNEDACPECRKVNCMVIKQHEGSMVCTQCGIVSQIALIDQTNEKRIYSSELHGADQASSRV